MKQTQVSNISIDIKELLNEYSEEVQEQIKETAKRVADEGKNELQNIAMPSPSQSGSAIPSTRRQWNKYAKDWSVKVVDGANFISCIVYNKKHYQLTHLLEYGHATRNGLRTRAFKHIEPVEQNCIDKYTKEIEKAIKQ